MKAKEKTKKKQKKSIVKPLLGVLVVAIVVGCAMIPLMQNLNFGLDLQGGFEVLYKVESIDGKKVTSDMMKSTYKTIEKRIDVLGVTEPSIVVEGDDRIRVQLAGVTDPEEARNLISQAANLTFRDTSDNLIMSSDVLKSGGAKVSQDSYGKPAVALSVADNSKFYRATKKVSEMSDNRLVIWLDFDPETDSFQTEQANCGSLSNSKCLSVATVSQGFSSDVIIQGNFTEQEVNSLVELINSGSLPTKLTEVSSKTVVASFGADSLSKTFVAGVVGVAGIVFLMCALYRFSGFIASIGLLFYTAITFLVFWLIGGVLTLPGIAALVIGIGMAVDATVISFSRIKDELYNGTKLNMAFKLGNKNSFMTIFDSNITTLISAIILFIFGESSVKGFATMLIISTIVTMVVMVFITRYLVGLFVTACDLTLKKLNVVGLELKVVKIHKEGVAVSVVDIVYATVHERGSQPCSVYLSAAHVYLNGLIFSAERVYVGNDLLHQLIGNNVIKRYAFLCDICFKYSRGRAESQRFLYLDIVLSHYIDVRCRSACYENAVVETDMSYRSQRVSRYLDLFGRIERGLFAAELDSKSACRFRSAVYGRGLAVIYHYSVAFVSRLYESERKLLILACVSTVGAVSLAVDEKHGLASVRSVDLISVQKRIAVVALSVINVIFDTALTFLVGGSVVEKHVGYVLSDDGRVLVDLIRGIS